MFQIREERRSDVFNLFHRYENLIADHELNQRPIWDVFNDVFP